jgi:hypothetical protein
VIKRLVSERPRQVLIYLTEGLRWVGRFHQIFGVLSELFVVVGITINGL